MYSHHALTYTGSLYTAYINGVSVGTYSGGGGTYADTQLFFGSGYGGKFKGRMDDIRAYSRCLNASEIMRLYLNSMSGYPGLLLQPQQTNFKRLSTGNLRRRFLVGTA